MWPLYLALKHLFPSGKRISFFTLISITGVALGVAVLLIVMSVMTGFHTDIRRMVTDTEGEVQIKSPGLITNYAKVVAQVKKVPGVVAATPYAAGVVGVEAENRPAYPEMRGLDLSTVEEVVNLRRYVRIGSLDDLDDDSVILSSELAHSLQAGVGSTLQIYSPLLFEKLKSDELFLPREVKVVGILEIGHQQLDSSTVYCTLRLAQDLYGLGHAAHGINVRIQPGLDEDEAAQRINAVLAPPLQAFSWMDTFSDFLWVLQLEKNMIFFLLLFIVIVAGFSVASSLLISVVRKTREIGILSALGGRTRQIAACFCFQGLLIGVVGTVSGLILGFVALTFRNDIVLGIARASQREEVLRRFYQFSRLPAHTDVSDVVKIVVASIVISTLAGLLPAWRAAKLKPVEALRSE
ncbi:MAG TPA: ABC transporter permease [Opitutaceae bacterium]